jgi:hypothetical protein
MIVADAGSCQSLVRPKLRCRCRYHPLDQVNLSSVNSQAAEAFYRGRCDCSTSLLSECRLSLALPFHKSSLQIKFRAKLIGHQMNHLGQSRII